MGMRVLDNIFDIMNTMEQFIHLHVHTTYSFLDGGNKISDCVKRAKELGMTSIAITDHNHVGGWYDFKDACKEEGIKPIYGCEMYQTWDTKILSLTADERRELAIKNYTEATGLEIPEKIGKKKITKKEIDAIIKDYIYNTKQYHIVLLAMNQTGLNNLIKLQSEAADTCTYNGRYCCDMDMLERHNEGIICLSACLGGMLPYAIRHNESIVDELVLRYKNIFGDRFYLEMQPLFIEEQELVNNRLIELSNEYNIELVATNDVHYTLREDADDHDSLLCVGIGKNKFDTERMRYEEEFWIRDYDEMYEAFERQTIDMEVVKRALANTTVIADRVSADIKLGSDKPLFPEVFVPQGLTPEKYLTLKSYKNLYRYKNEHPEIDVIAYEKRLYEELDIINSKGFAPYILKIFENVEYCESVDIPIGPGRGSAAGALTLFVNGATKIIDPIKYNLLFFRFLTKDRVDPPDVDMDYSYYGRDQLIRHLEEVHGQAAVSHIGTYTTMGVKSGLKDFGRVLCIEFMTMNNITRMIDEITEEAPSIKFKDLDKYETDAVYALEEEHDEALYNKLIDKATRFKNLENQYPELFRLARKFEGTPRNMGVHASGVLVMPCDVTDYFPTRTVDGIRVALFTGPQLESLGAIKLDILGLKTLDVLDKTIKAEDPTATVNDLYKEIEKHLDDCDIFEMTQNKETEGLFQMESNLFKGLCSDIMPTDINDICAILAIGRPGPLSAGMHTRYAQRKNGFEVAIPQIKGTDEITKDTFHTIIYQEQCMLIAKLVAGFDDTQADSILRKALAKKKKDKMELARRLFIYGKRNCKPPTDYDESNTNQCIYDPKGKYGAPVIGGVHNGYSEQELTEFWEKLKGYASYLFNKSHSATYAVITLCTMYLKKKLPAKFFAALLSMQEQSDKIDLYSKTAKGYGINVTVPDVNYSLYDFTERNGSILYGLKSVKGLGENSIANIIENRPYANIKETLEKMDKKHANKRVMLGLVKAGAFDFYNPNRYETMNELMDIRKDKDERFVSIMYGKDICMSLESEVLGTSITYQPWWETVKAGELFEQTLVLKKVLTKPDKKGNMMGFITFNHEGIDLDALVFSNLYKKTSCSFNIAEVRDVTIQGTKEASGKIIVKQVLDVNTLPYNPIEEDTEELAEAL